MVPSNTSSKAVWQKIQTETPPTEPGFGHAMTGSAHEIGDDEADDDEDQRNRQDVADDTFFRRLARLLRGQFDRTLLLVHSGPFPTTRVVSNGNASRRRFGPPALIAEEARPQRAAVGILRREDRTDILADAEEALRPVAGPRGSNATGQRQRDERRGNPLFPRQHS